ncbi:ATP-dependent DNA helicase Snf21 [Sorochytrium milnesiophthora]
MDPRAPLPLHLQQLQHQQQQQQQHQQQQQLQQQQQQPQSQNAPPRKTQITQENLNRMVHLLKEKQRAGLNEHNDPEYRKVFEILKAITQHSKSMQAAAAAAAAAASTSAPAPGVLTAGPIHSGDVGANGHPSYSQQHPVDQPMPAQQQQFGVPAGGGTTNLADSQLGLLKMQMQAYKLLSKNMPVPPQVQQAMIKEEPGVAPEHFADAQSQQQETAVAAPAQQPAQLTPDMKIAIVNPHAMAKKLTEMPANPAKLQRYLVPAIMPAGLDPIAMQEERDRRLQARMAYRLQELEKLPGNLADEAWNEFVDANQKHDQYERTQLKTKALIELKALRLYEKQRRLREDVLGGLQRSSLLFTGPDRAAFRRVKRHTLREPRTTEQLEKRQKYEREKKERQKHIDYIGSIIAHGVKLRAWHAKQQERMSKLGKQALTFHQRLEEAELERKKKLSQERLRALREGDEEAYRKLIDDAKDTRIKNFLQQTDEYLEKLALSVAEQKSDIAQLDSKVAIAEVNASVGEDGEDLDEDQVIVVQGRKMDYYNTAHRIQETVTDQATLLTGGRLKDYQIKGLEWMVSLYNNQLNGILADEMGLGKTIQSISFIGYLIEKKYERGPYLVIVPLSVITNWAHEFEKWAPTIKTLILKGAPSARRKVLSQLRQPFHVLITTPEYINGEKRELAKIKWLVVIIDEAHRLKNKNSVLSQNLRNDYRFRYRLLLTGTPLQNDLQELWALLNFILPKVFQSMGTFEDWFAAPFMDSGEADDLRLNEEEQLLVIKRLHKVLRPFLLRRLKKDVESELPDKVERIVKTKLSALQKKLYDQVCNYGIIIGGENKTTGKAGVQGLNNTVMQLRKICNHPFVFPVVDASFDNGSGFTDDNIYRVSGKFELLDRLLAKLFRTGHRVLMFFQMTQIMQLMSDYLEYRSIQYLRLDGSTKTEDRQEYLKMFNAPDSPYQIFLLSTRAGGLGLNLQTADTVIIFDSDWNPHQDLQAQDRAHRIGQTKEVRILRLITENSIEERILARAQQKLNMDEKVIQAGKFDNKTSAAEREAFLRSLLENDVEKNDVDDEEEMTDEELNTILARSDAELVLFRQMDLERDQREETEWIARGGQGPKPERLITDEELPEVFHLDPKQWLNRNQELPESGASRRSRRDVRYDDGLTLDEYSEAVDAGIDPEEYAELKQRMNARQATGGVRDADTSSIHSDDSRQAGGRKSRSRKSRAGDGVEDVDEDSASGLPEPTRKRGRPRKHPIPDEEEEELGAKRRKVKEDDDGGDRPPPAMRPKINEQCYMLLRAVENDVDTSTIPPRERAEIFLTLPSKRDYPDYYQIIHKPVALSTIRKRITTYHYHSLAECKADFDLMFANARTYNTEGSWVYNDANHLEAVVQSVYDSIAPLSLPQQPMPPTTQPSTFHSPMRHAQQASSFVGADSGDDDDDDDDSGDGE